MFCLSDGWEEIQSLMVHVTDPKLGLEINYNYRQLHANFSADSKDET